MSEAKTLSGRRRGKQAANPASRGRARSDTRGRAKPDTRGRAKPARARGAEQRQARPARSRRPPMDARIKARRQRVAEEQARRRRRLVASVVVVVALAAGAVGLTYTPLFEVGEVIVDGTLGEREQEVRIAAGVVPGQRLLGVDLETTGEAVEGLPWVRTAEVTRRPPSTVAIEVASRQPVAVVRTVGEAWLIDRDGVLVGGGADESLVDIVAREAVLPDAGSVVEDAAVRNALAVHEELPASLRAAVLHYEAPSERGLRLLLDGAVLGQGGDPVWVRMGTAERVEAKAQVLVLLLEQVRADGGLADGGAVGELDVRAPDNPVIVPREG